MENEKKLESNAVKNEFAQKILHCTPTDGWFVWFYDFRQFFIREKVLWK
jgi:hypothetical protein